VVPKLHVNVSVSIFPPCPITLHIQYVMTRNNHFITGSLSLHALHIRGNYVMQGIEQSTSLICTLLPYHVDTLTEMETPERSEMDSHTFHFKGVTDIYGTVPRRHRHRGTPPAPKPPSTIAVSRRSSHTLSQDAQSRRAQRFSQLLEFTKQQSGFAPQSSKLQVISQSLPPSRPQLFSPQREVVIEEMENATVSFPAVKPQEFPSQDASSIDQQVQRVTELYL